MKIFAIIVTYNAMRRNWAERCLMSLRQSTVAVTPVVIDNGSTDGTGEYITSHFPEAVWLPQERNLGFGQANNVGFRYALNEQADYVLLLNQDACVETTTLSALVEAAKEEALYTPVHMNGDGSRFDFMFRAALLRKPGEFVDDLYGGRELQNAYPVGEICAACWFLPMSVVRRIGGFNPMFFHYGEDGNYYQRLVYHKVPVFLVPKARMMHDRKQFGDENAYNRNKVRRDLLLICCDINRGAGNQLIEVLRVAARLQKGQWTIFLRELWWMMMHAGEIKESRQKDRNGRMDVITGKQMELGA